MLHIINSFPISHSFLDNTNTGDTVIFTDNAVLAVKQENIETEKESFSQKALDHINLCVRKADLLIRNISSQDLLHGVVVIDEAQFKDVISEDFVFKSCN